MLALTAFKFINCIFISSIKLNVFVLFSSFTMKGAEEIAQLVRV